MRATRIRVGRRAAALRGRTMAPLGRLGVTPPGPRSLLSFLLLIGLLGWPREAAAYIDPGTGSLAYQTLLAIVLGIGAFFRPLRRRIASLFRRRGPRDGTDPPQGAPPPD